MPRIRRAAFATAVVAVASVAAAVLSAAPASAVSPAAPAGFAVHGFDVSDFSADADTKFADAASDGAAFAFVKVGEGSYEGGANGFELSPTFSQQWYAAAPAGLVHGAYYVADLGDKTTASDPVAQANALITAAGQQLGEAGTLPLVLDLEQGASTTCWMLDDTAWNAHAATNQARMVTWISKFSQTIETRLGRAPLIYTNPNWWNTCTGGSAAFTTNGLWIASYGNAGSTPVLPRGWGSYAFWQWNQVSTDASRPAFPGDQDVFHGSLAALQTIASGAASPGAIAPGTPKITGTAKVGATVTASPGTWTHDAKLSYQWFANGKAIAGAKSSKLALKAAQYKAQIRVKVTGSLAGYTPVTVVSGHTANVAAGKMRTTAVKLAGTARVGRYLAAKKGAWTSGTKFVYRWYANGKPIARATKPSLKLSAALRGKTIVAKVTGTRTGYVKTTVASKKSAVVR